MYEEPCIQLKKRREVKNKGERERFTHLNAEFQRIAKRDKKAFFNGQWNLIKEKNRIGNTRNLFKKIGDTKGIFHANMGKIKKRNYMDLTEEEYIIKKWQECTDQISRSVVSDSL